MKAGRVVGIVASTVVVLWVVTPSFPVARPGAAAEVTPRTVTIYGAGFGAIGEVTPSGQGVAKVATPELVFAPGRRLHRTVRAADGTLLMAAMSHNDSHDRPTSGEMVIGAYHPDGGGIDTIRLSTSAGLESSRDSDGYQVAATVTALLPLPGGDVAFTARPARLDHDVSREGVWPVFGLLSKVDGRWVVARQWTPEQLGPQACEDDGNCLHPNGLALMPESGDIVVAQLSGAVTVLRRDGLDVEVMAHFRYQVPVSIREVRADPTGKAGQERFVVGIDVERGPGVLQEFTYDSRSGAISVASAPVLPGDLTSDEKAFQGYQWSVYDHLGNLWVSRQNGSTSGALAVYTRPLCPHNPKRKPADYRSTRGQLRAWGLSCRPDYDILQAKELPPPRGLVEDPATGTVVMLADGGALLAVRVARGPGSRLSFEVGNVVDLGHKLLAVGAMTRMRSELGAIGADHRLWLPTSRIKPSRDGVTVEHLMMSINLDDLFEPPPIELPGTPGRSVVVQAEQTSTTATSQSDGSGAEVAVDSAVYVKRCLAGPSLVGCGYDGQPGNGFHLADSTQFGHFEGDIEYRVRVPHAGRYRLSYRVATFPATDKAVIQLSAGGRAYRTRVSTSYDWRQFTAADTVFLRAGVQTITLQVPPGLGGWFLNSFTLTRV